MSILERQAYPEQTSSSWGDEGFGQCHRLVDVLADGLDITVGLGVLGERLVEVLDERRVGD